MTKPSATKDLPQMQLEGTSGNDSVVDGLKNLGYQPELTRVRLRTWAPSLLSLLTYIQSRGLFHILFSAFFFLTDRLYHAQTSNFSSLFK